MNGPTAVRPGRNGSDQVLITHTARAGLFIFNLHRYVFYFQFAAQFLVYMYYI